MRVTAFLEIFMIVLILSGCSSGPSHIDIVQSPLTNIPMAPTLTAVSSTNPFVSLTEPPPPTQTHVPPTFVPTTAPDECTAENQVSFPVGVFFVRGQKPIFDEDAPSDFRVDPWRARREYAAEFADLEQEGFNIVMMSVSPIAYGEQPEAVVHVLLEEAQTHHLCLILPLESVQGLLASLPDELSDADITAALEQDLFPLFRGSPAVLGYFIFDEPVPADEPGPEGQQVYPEQLGQVRAFIENAHPGALALSSWADVNHMAKLQDGMHSQILFMPIYPLAEEQAIGDFSDAWPRGNPEDGSFAAGADQPTYSEYLEMAQEAAGGIPQWVIVQAFEPIPPEHPHYWRMPTPKELRFEIFDALAHGAQGVFYFLYQSEDWVHGLRDEHYQPTPLLEEAQEINAKIRQMSPVLLTIRRAGVNLPQPEGGEAFAFMDDGGNRYLFLVNADVENAASLEAHLPAVWTAQTAEDVYDGAQWRIQRGVFIVDIAPGDGRLLRLR